MLKKPFMMTS